MKTALNLIKMEIAKEKQAVEAFIEALKNKDLEITQILDDYCLNAALFRKGTADSKKYLEMYIQKTVLLRNDLTTFSYQLESFEVSEKKADNSLKELKEKNGTFVVWVAGIPKHYIKMQNDKVMALMPMTKGDKIVGWM